MAHPVKHPPDIGITGIGAAGIFLPPKIPIAVCIPQIIHVLFRIGRTYQNGGVAVVIRIPGGHQRRNRQHRHVRVPGGTWPIRHGRVRYLQRRPIILLFIRIQFENRAPLFQVVLAGFSTGCFTRPGKGGQKYGRQNADNSNHNQELNKSKAFMFHCCTLLFFMFMTLPLLLKNLSPNPNTL